jgi:hypothetical protein
VLAENHITDIFYIGQLSNLVWLDLQNNNISDIAALTRLIGTPLTTVYLEENYIDISSGSSALNTIDQLIANGITVYYEPQKAFIDMTSQLLAWGIPSSQLSADYVHGPLGLSNILAYAMGINPFEADITNLPTNLRDRIFPDLWRFQYQRNTRAVGVQLIPEFSADLIVWESIEPLDLIIIDDSGEGIQKVEVSVQSESSGLFFRIMAVSQ